MIAGTTFVLFKMLTAYCDNCACTQIAQKAKKVIISDVPNEVVDATILEFGKDVIIISDERKIILYGGKSSLILPCTHIGGKHVLQLSRKKCGTVTVSRYNDAVIVSSVDRSYRVHAGSMR